MEGGSIAQAACVYVVGPAPAGVKQNKRTASAAGAGSPNRGRPDQRLGRPATAAAPPPDMICTPIRVVRLQQSPAAGRATVGLRYPSDLHIAHAHAQGRR
jgi:hypothetical protein